MQLPGQGRFLIPRWGTWLVALSCVALAACAAWIGTFAHPQADDYVYANLVRDHGLFGAMVEYYMTWNGRAVASAMCFLALGADMPLAVYRSLPPLLLLGLFVCFRAFVGALVPRGVSPSGRWLMAAMLTLLYFTGMTSLREGMYWASGSLNYQPSHMLGLLLAAVLLKRPVPRIAPWLAPVLALAMAMSNESGMLVEAVALTMGATWAFSTRAAGRWAWAAALLGCAVGMALDLGAPGLRVRSALEDDGSGQSRDFLWSFAGSFRYASVTLLRLLIHPALWGVLILGLPWLVRGNGSLRRRPGSLWVVAVPVLWLGLSAAAVFPVQFATGINPPGRIMNVSGWVLVAGCLPGAGCLVALALRLQPLRRFLAMAPGRALVVAGVLAVAAGLFLNQNALRLIRDMPSAPQYDREMRAIHQSMAEASRQGRTDVRVKPIGSRPGTIAYHSLPEDPNSWHCRAVAQFYGLHSVATLPR